ncbi:hypothetical protein ABTA78_19570, partial [Acinetobacter baumannii]
AQVQPWYKIALFNAKTWVLTTNKSKPLSRQQCESIAVDATKILKSCVSEMKAYRVGADAEENERRFKSEAASCINYTASILEFGVDAN